MTRTIPTTAGPLGPIRPRFELVVPLDAQQTLASIDAALAQPDSPCLGSVMGHHVELLVRREQRHFWSPWLSAEVLPHARGAMIEGRFGPHPNVWTGLAAAYAVLGFGILSALIYGFCQWAIDVTPWALWGVPIALLLGLGLYAGSQIGQRLGAQQMATIRAFVQRAVAGPVQS